ncbi:protein preY, mitochondrial [Cololabis saira]|uniref:protein preY, mitochondrial n=1 Tax=Cololabis saira TaxID=129043 RepID=UPI002AD51D7B|nr:protein preY, mitochondrial [Cololabis saira]
MFRNVWGRFLRETVRVRHHVKLAPSTQTSSPAGVVGRSFSAVKDEASPPFDSSLLELLVCPLSKKPLRYDAATNELINEELGIAYPVIDGIPNMIPQEARLIKKDTSNSTQQ